MVEFEEAVRLSTEAFTEVSLRSVHIALGKCEVLTKIMGRKVEPLVLRYLNYAELAVGENDRVITFALRILVFGDLIKLKLDNCLKNINRALRILQRMPFNTHFNLFSLMELSVALT